MHFCELLRHQYTTDDFILHGILWKGDMCFTYESVFNFCDSPSGYLFSQQTRVSSPFSATIGLVSYRTLLWTPFCYLTGWVFNNIIIFLETDLSWLLKDLVLSDRSCGFSTTELQLIRKDTSGSSRTRRVYEAGLDGESRLCGLLRRRI
jgi:hypothetical protein